MDGWMPQQQYFFFLATCRKTHTKHIPRTHGEELALNGIFQYTMTYSLTIDSTIEIIIHYETKQSDIDMTSLKDAAGKSPSQRDVTEKTVLSAPEIHCLTPRMYSEHLQQMPLEKWGHSCYESSPINFFIMKMGEKCNPWLPCNLMGWAKAAWWRTMS